MFYIAEVGSRHAVHAEIPASAQTILGKVRAPFRAARNWDAAARVCLWTLILAGALVGALATPYAAHAALVSGPHVVPAFNDRLDSVSNDSVADLSDAGNRRNDGRAGDARENLLARASSDRGGYDQGHRLSRGAGSRSFDKPGAGACLDFRQKPKRIASVFGEVGRGDRGHSDDGHGDRHDDHVIGSDWIYDFNRDRHDNRDNPHGAWGRSHHDWGKHHWHHGHRPPVIPLPPSVWLFGSALLGLAMITRRRAVR